MFPYYVNNTESAEGDHEVHKSGCYWLSIAVDTSFLGYHSNCASAVAKAKLEHHWNSNGCIHCSEACHTG